MPQTYSVLFTLCYACFEFIVHDFLCLVLLCSFIPLASWCSWRYGYLHVLRFSIRLHEVLCFAFGVFLLCFDSALPWYLHDSLLYHFRYYLISYISTTYVYGWWTGLCNLLSTVYAYNIYVNCLLCFSEPFSAE